MLNTVRACSSGMSSRSADVHLERAAAAGLLSVATSLLHRRPTTSSANENTWLLGARVDLVPEAGLKAGVRAAAEADLVPL